MGNESNDVFHLYIEMAQFSTAMFREFVPANDMDFECMDRGIQKWVGVLMRINCSSIHIPISLMANFNMFQKFMGISAKMDMEMVMSPKRIFETHSIPYRFQSSQKILLAIRNDSIFRGERPLFMRLTFAA